MKETLALFDKGLSLNAPSSSLTEGYLHRARGMHALCTHSFRTRPGSSLIAAHNAHSITYFNNTYHYGVDTLLYRHLTSIKTGLSGSRLSFSKMPPVAGIVDYLFCSGGGELFKIDSSGNVTAWGFAAPITGTLSAAAVAGGSLVAGVYKYQITYYNEITGHRSNGNGVDISVTTAGANLTARISNIPNPAAIDSQITHVELWRSVIDGDALFYLTRIAISTPTFDDDGSLDVSSEELSTTNLPPDENYFDCLGPHNASMFWLSSNSGERGRIYYSPIGYAESVEGFINVCSNDTPLHKLFRYQGQLGVIGEAGIYIIGGANPYVSREVSGCPGTNKPHTVVIIPDMGMMYEASDGVRLFNGSTSDIIAPDTTSLAFKVKIPGAIDRIFRGEASGDLTAFSGTIAEFARNEYIISDTIQSLAFDVTLRRWRDLGVGFNALFYNKETDEIAGAINNNVLSFEAESQTTDNTTPIPLSFEPRHVSFTDDKKHILQHLTIDINPNGQNVSIILLHNDSTTTLGIVNYTSRNKYTFAVGIEAERFGIRLTGSLTAAVELHRIDFIFNDTTTQKAAEND